MKSTICLQNIKIHYFLRKINGLIIKYWNYYFFTWNQILFTLADFFSNFRALCNNGDKTVVTRLYQNLKALEAWAQSEW